jgi:hypothetical protein
MAELVIQGNHVEWRGFRKPGRLTGTVRLNTAAKQMLISPEAEAGVPPKKAIVFTYRIEKGVLTLIDSERSAIRLHKQPTSQDPLANVQVEFVSAIGINTAGDLLVTRFTALQVGRAGTTCFVPTDGPLSTKQATILLVQNDDCRRISLDEARRRIHEPTLVAIAYWGNDRLKRSQLHELWKNAGPPRPDSAIVSRTFSRMLRPGALVFVLSPRENVVEP